MLSQLQNTTTLTEHIYALEPLAYYFNLKPNEFWDNNYREINIYIQANLSRIIDNFKQEIELQEAVTNKLIMADAMSIEKPKVISLFKIYKDLFEQL